VRRSSWLVAAAAGLCCAAPALNVSGVASSAVTLSPGARAGTLPTPIRHVVFILQENHSFDNVLGAWCAQTSRCDGATSGQLYGGGSIALSTATDAVPYVLHTGPAQVTAIDGGRMDGFSLVEGCTSSKHYACYSQYQPGQIPNVTALANQFAVADRTFEDGPAPSWGSHLQTVTADMDGFAGGTPHGGKAGVLGPGWGCDSGDDTLWTSPSGIQKIVPACVPDPSLDPSLYPYGGAYRKTPVPYVPTIMDRLEAAGLSWRIYAGLGGTENSNGYGWAICPTFAECLDTTQHQKLVADTKVLDAAAKGRLPNFAVVTPTQANSQHNGDSMAAGDNWIGSVVSALENGPQWKSTAIFLTWDDCGCLYDHVAPPAGRGIRVPMVIISPYALAGSTDRHDASFASVLAFTEHVFNLPALSGDDATAYDFMGSFDFTQQPLAPVNMTQTPIPSAELRALAANPPDADDPT
jgi:phospholipase C